MKEHLVLQAPTEHVDARCALTEGQPCLSDLQVDREVRLEAQLLERHISTCLSLQGSVLHVAVEDTYKHQNKRFYDGGRG